MVVHMFSNNFPSLHPSSEQTCIAKPKSVLTKSSVLKPSETCDLALFFSPKAKLKMKQNKTPVFFIFTNMMKIQGDENSNNKQDLLSFSIDGRTKYIGKLISVNSRDYSFWEAVA